MRDEENHRPPEAAPLGDTLPAAGGGMYDVRIEPRPEDPVARGSPHPTRREVIAGSAAAVLAAGGPAEAATTPSVTVEYEDASRRALIVTYERARGGPARGEKPGVLRLDAASFYALQDVEDSRRDGILGRFIRYRTENGWAARLHGAQFPGGSPFEVLLSLEPDESKQNWRLWITLQRLAGYQIVLRTGAAGAAANLDDFLLKRSPEPIPELAAALSEAESRALMRELFGGRLLFAEGPPREATLRFHRDGYFRLVARGKARFSVLQDRGRDCVVFSGLVFAMLAREQPEPDSREDRRVVRRPDAFLLRKPSGPTCSAGAAPSKAKPADEDVRALFDNEELRQLPSKQKGAVLYGRAEDPKFEHEFAAGSASGVAVRLGPEASSAARLEPGAVEVGLRNAGIPQETVMALRSGFVLQVSPEARAGRGEAADKPRPEARFDALRGTLWRGINAGVGDTANSLDMVAELEPQCDVNFEIATRIGPFCVRALPPIPPRPGAKARVPPIRIESTAGGTLTRFAAPMALTHAAIALEGDADIFSSLDFHEAECLFRVPDVRVGRVRRDHSGKVVPEARPPQTEVIVPLGPLEAQAQISLSRARLTVRRPRDLLSLTYRFQDLVLEIDATGKWIVPDRHTAAFVGHRPPLPEVDLKPLGRALPANATDAQIRSAKAKRQAKDARLPEVRRSWFRPTRPQPACEDPEPALLAPSRFDAPRDPSPLMVVEFPPQHIAERAFFRQLPAEPGLPMPAAGKEASREDAEILRDGEIKDRLVRRKELKETQHAPGSPFAKFVEEFAKEAATLPEDQRIYVGEEFLDPAARRIARKIAHNINKAETDIINPQEVEDSLRALPDIDVPRQLLVELREELGLVSPPSDPRPGRALDEPKDLFNRPEWAQYLRRREKLKEQRDTVQVDTRPTCGRSIDPKHPLPRSSYAKFRSLYGPLAGKSYGGVTAPKEYPGRASYIEFVRLLKVEDRKQAIEDIRKLVDDLDKELRQADAFCIPAEARASGPSRLAFRIPADDFEGGRPDPDRKPGDNSGKPVGAFPFTLAALTNWGSFDLAVVRRAEKLFDPLSGGRAAKRWARSETLDEGEKLLHQGLSPGDTWARRDSEGRIDADCVAPTSWGKGGRVSGAQRMAEIYASSREPPRWHETAIEMPFRLMLSPAQDATFRTPLPIPPAIARKLEFTPGPERPVPLWFASLEETPGGSSVRAIWSPDFRPHALADIERGTPPRGPWAPWALARELSSANPPSTSDPPEEFRASLDAYDRHELVALSSVHGLPVRGRRKEDGSLTDLSQVNVPPGFELSDIVPETLGVGTALADRSAIYKPQPLGVGELTLTALGGTFDADTAFVPPASAKVVVPPSFIRKLVPREFLPGLSELKDGRRNLFDALSIERWRHLAVLGRDIKVEVVYKGFLFPLGHRASLIKLTERRFYGLDGRPVAFLIQRMFLRVGMPEKTYPAIGQPNGGRRWPVERLEILTRVTPDIVDPTAARVGSGPGTMDSDQGRIFLREKTEVNATAPGLVFWPRTAPRDGSEVRFEMQIDRRGQRVRLPLIFVDNTAANNEAAMRLLTDYYNGLKDEPLKPANEWRRRMQHGGIKRRYAPETEPDSTSFETLSWLLAAEGQERKPVRLECKNSREWFFDNTDFDFSSLLQGADQPPFYPVCAQAEVRIERVERMVGGKVDSIKVHYDDEYQAYGFPDAKTLETQAGPPCEERAQADVFIDFEASVPMEMGAAGERTGGATRPKTNLIGVSRSRGPVGGEVEPAPAGAPRPTSVPKQPASAQLARPSVGSFFDADAKILGILTFNEALKFLLAAIAQTPEFKEVTEYASSLIGDKTLKASEAIAKVRDTLLIPLRDALDVLQREWRETLAEGASSSDADAKLARLYPDVGASYSDLRAAIQAAIEASATVAELPALTAHFAKVYAAGRRFIAAIDRVASDPVAPVRAALKDAFKTALDDLMGAAADLLAGVTLEGLRTIRSDVKALVTALINAEELVAYRRFVFALPAVGFVSPVPVGSRSEAETTIEDDFKRAFVLEGGTLIDALGASDTARTQAALNALADKLVELLEQDIRALRAQVPSRDDLADVIADALNGWTARAAQAGDRIKGIAFDAASDSLRQLLAGAESVARALQPGEAGGAFDPSKIDLKKLLEALKLLAGGAKSIIQPALDNVLDGARTLCGEATAAIIALLEVLAPSPAAVPADDCKIEADVNCGAEDPPKLIAPIDPREFAREAIRLLTQLKKLSTAVRDYADASAGPLKTNLSTLAGNIDTLASDLRRVAEIAAQQVMALERAAVRFRAEFSNIAANACTVLDPAAVARLPLDALSGLTGPQAVLIDALAALVESLKRSIAAGVPANLRDALATLTGVLSLASPQTAKRQAAINELIAATRAVAGLAFDAQRIAQDITSLKAMPGGLAALETALNEFAGLLRKSPFTADAAKTIDEARSVIAQSRNEVVKAEQEVRAALAALRDDTIDATETKIREAFDRLDASLTRAESEVNAKLKTLIALGEQALLRQLSKALIGGEAYRIEAFKLLAKVLAPAVEVLSAAQAQLVLNRDKVYAQLTRTGVPAGNERRDALLADLSRLTLAQIGRLLLVAPPQGTRAFAPALSNDPREPRDDYLTAEAADLGGLRSALKDAADNNKAVTPETAERIRLLLTDWAAGRASATVLADTVRRAAERVLSGDLGRVVDLEGARRRVEAKIKEMIPSKVTLSYWLDAEMKPFKLFGFDLFVPQQSKRLTIDAGASYDLLDPSQPPVFIANAELSAFDINLFEVVTLMFDGAQFNNDSRKGSDFALTYRDFKIGEKAAFIQPLQKFLNPQGSGPYVKPTFSPIGIEAGYKLDLGIISIGNVSFSNVSLNAACRLPFENRQAIFTVSIGRRDAPFIISAAPYGGGGFLGLLANSKRMIGFEASFEFGGAGAFKFGPLEGQGRITTGIYVNHVEGADQDGPQGTTVDGFFFAGGSAHIACFSMSTSLVVRISQQPGGDMQGSATYTYSFSIGVKDIEFKVRVGKTEKKGFSGSRQASLTLGPTRFAALGDLSAARVHSGGSPATLRIRADAACQGVDWKRHDSYFTDDLDGFPL